MTKVKTPLWLSRPEDHDYDAAFDYLSLLYDPLRVNWTVDSLLAAPVVTRKAKDILRASRLPMLTDADRSVARDIRKVQTCKALSPVLLVRDNGRLHIADGYHRVCACYYFGDDTTVCCVLTGMR